MATVGVLSPLPAVCACAQVPPEVSAELLKQLEEMGFPPNRCAYGMGALGEVVVVCAFGFWGQGAVSLQVFARVTWQCPQLSDVVLGTCGAHRPA